MMPLSIRLGPARFLDPMVGLVVLLGLALYLAFRDTPPRTARGRRARVLAGGVWAGLWILSMPAVGDLLARWTETRGPDLAVALAGKDRGRTAVVVLASGLRTYDEFLPPRERLDAAGTQRVLTASRLFREHGAGTFLISGSPTVMAEAMRDLAVSEGVPAERVVLEDRSLNTRENAAYSTAILRERGIDTAVVVTSATHLRRSVKDFTAVGMPILPAPAEIVGRLPLGIDSFLPSSGGLYRTHVCLHEILGYVRG